MEFPHRRTCRIRATVACALALGLAAAAPAQGRYQQGNGEFGASGVNVLRIESEAKLRVPLEATEAVWTWLVQRYADCSWLDRDGSRFSAVLGDELFEDVYFDTPALQLLATDSGIRHRSRIVKSGGAIHKDGRQLVQIKINRGDSSGLDRGEIKYTVNPGGRTAEAQHQLLGLVDQDEREDCIQRIAEAGIDPYALRRVLAVDQVRRRVYLSDQQGAMATLTLDECSLREWGVRRNWTEIELELNEVRYTEANEAKRAWMKKLVADVQADLQRAFPAIVQDQTPKYTKAFRMMESGAVVPIRPMIERGVKPDAFFAGVFVLVASVLCTGVFFVRRAVLRRRAH